MAVAMTPFTMVCDWLLCASSCICGAVWEMVTGMHPFPGCRDGEIVRRVCAGERPSFPAHIPAAYVELAEACWAGDQKLRPSFDELLVRLRKLLETADELQAACEEPLKELHSWIMTF